MKYIPYSMQKKRMLFKAKAIIITHLKKNYGNKEVLKRIDLSIDQGEIFVLLGKNGAGKSTLFNVLTGLAKETGGSLRFFRPEL